MNTKQFGTMDGNEAVAAIAYQLNEVIAIYPITPASPMGEWADAWAAAGVKNLWDAVLRWSKCRVRVARQARFTVRCRRER